MFGDAARRIASRFCGAAIATFMLTGPSLAADPPPLGKPEIVYAHAAWSSSRILYAVGKQLLEKIGYKVTDKVLDTGIIYTSLASGQVDLFSSSWLPGQQSYLNKYGDKLELISFSIVPVPGGLMVPSYVNANSIEDLKKPDIAKQFDGKIVGIDAGSGIMMGTKKVIDEYQLPLQAVPSSDAAMSAAFKAAYEQHKPIVVTGWCPHILCAVYNVKFLEDPKNIYGAARDLNVVRSGFRMDFPRATAFLSRLHPDGQAGIAAAGLG
jgi:glycine betaine/proline transport system substrate-binding protein